MVKSLLTGLGWPLGRPQAAILPMPLEVKERYLEIRAAGSDGVITVVELLSPTHRRQGEGRRIYNLHSAD
jgi:hypothetical protein